MTGDRTAGYRDASTGRSDAEPPVRGAAQVPSASSPELKSLLGIAVAAMSVAALYFGKDVLIPIMLAVMLSFVLSPLVNFLQGLNLWRAPSVILAVLAVGESSKTRHAILDAVEQLLLDQGYASVTYRGLAAKAEVTPALIQYYFPTLDEVFVATIRRNIDDHIGRLVDALQKRSHEPLRVIWEFSKEEVTGALTMEFIALGNHRKSIGAEIAEIAERVRKVQLDTINAAAASLRYAHGEFPPPVLLFILTGILKLLTIEANLGVSTSHADVIAAFERYLDTVEPRLPIAQ